MFKSNVSVICKYLLMSPESAKASTFEFRDKFHPRLRIYKWISGRVGYTHGARVTEVPITFLVPHVHSVVSTHILT